LDHLVLATPDLDSTVESVERSNPDPKPVKAVLKNLGLALALSGGPTPRLRARIDGPAGSLELA